MNTYITIKNIGIGLVVLAGIVIALQYSISTNSIKTETVSEGEALPEELVDASDFLIGQYYFNHDEDPAGPYDVEKARHYFARSIEADPRAEPQAWHQLGRIDFIEGRFDDAIYKFKKQIEYFDDFIPHVYYMLGLTHGYKARAQGAPEDWKQAEEYFSTFIQYTETEPWPYVDLAWVYFAQGKYQEMIEPLESGLEYSPDNPWLLNMYGLALFNTQAPEKAREQFLLAKQQAAELTIEQWGRSYPGNSPNDWEQGLEEFRQAIDKNIELTES